MIESPTTNAYIAEPTSPELEKHLLSQDSPTENKASTMTDADILLVKNTPITSKLRTAIRHIKVVAGPFARFRGLHIAFIYHALYSVSMSLLSHLAGPAPVFFRPLLAIIISIALCRIHMTWTHHVIAMPSSKSWWQRIPPRKLGRKLIGPTLVWAFARQVSVYVPGALFVNVFEILKHPEVYGGNPQTMQKVALIELFAIFFIFCATVVLIVVPAEVSLKRVEASMLPEEEDTIVPFDKSFAGRFKSEALGGPGAVSLIDAWRTFGKEARIRLIKLYAKVFAVQFAVAILFTMVLVGEVKLITGGDFQRLVEVARKSVKGEL